MTFDGKVSRRDLMLTGTALVAAGPLLAASRLAHAQEADLFATLLDRRQSLLQALSAQPVNLPNDVVYIQSNITTQGGNSILGYRRVGDGSLTPLPSSPYLTGGEGFLVNSIFAGPLAGDQQIVIDRLRGVLYAINGGSNSIAAMRIAADGSLTHLPSSPFVIPGLNPASLGLRLDSLVVANADSSTATPVGANPSLTLLGLDLDGGLQEIPSAQTALAAGSDPTQALTTNTGVFTFVCELNAPNISAYVIGAIGNDGLVRLLDQQVPPQQAGATSAPLPLGLAASPNAPVLYVGFTTTNQLGVYRWDAGGRLSFLHTATNSGRGICWLRVTERGHRLYTVNTGDNSISVYDTTRPQRPVEIQHFNLQNALGVLTQFEITPDQRYIYGLELGITEQNAFAGVLQVFPSQLRVFAIDPADGTVAEVSSALLTIDLPANTIPQAVVTL